MSFEKSESLLERALLSIPGGTQTFSKSFVQYPAGVSPLYAKRAQGCRLWDVDDNEFLDFVNGLAAVNLGYCDEDVTQAVMSQIAEGVTLSLPMSIEIELAEKLISVIPCAESVRFGKNGSDATAAAVRCARSFTGRDHVVVCGYHGWQDWYIGSTSRDMGVPLATRSLTHRFIFNDIDSLEVLFKQYPNQIACVILEPAGPMLPENRFLESTIEIAHQFGALVIFDEVITGFRLSIGGAQEYFGVTPDLTSLGKGLANGYPLSALVGKRKYMECMKDVFFSTTHGSEALSIAAALATIEKIERESVTEHLYSLGTDIQRDIGQLISKYSIDHLISLSGHPAWSFLNFADFEEVNASEIKTYWLQECFSNGILCLGTHNISFSHTKEEVKSLIEVYDRVFASIADAVLDRDLHSKLKCDPINPLFRVR